MINSSISSVDEKRHDGQIVFTSEAMRRVLTMADKAAASEVAVLLEGESGVGKEVFARHIHANSMRAIEPFVPVNCGAIPETLFEAELFLDFDTYLN